MSTMLRERRVRRLPSAIPSAACTSIRRATSRASSTTATATTSARSGLVKNAEALDSVAKFDTLIVESTGALTKGKPKLVAVLPEKGHEVEEVLHLAVWLSRGFEHPLAEAISHGIEERGVTITGAREVEPITGKGVTGTVDGRAVALGNARLIAEIGVDGGAHSETANDRRDQGETVLFVVADGAIAGLVNVADLVKETTPKAFEALHGLGSRIIMVTGDNERTAKAVAGKLGIDEIRAEELPEDKARVIKELQYQSGRVMMAGAGVVIQSAGFTLVKGNSDGFSFLIEINGIAPSASLHGSHGSMLETEKGNLVERRDTSTPELRATSHAHLSALDRPAAHAGVERIRDWPHSRWRSRGRGGVVGLFARQLGHRR